MTRRVVIGLYPGHVALDVVGPHEVFALAMGIAEAAGRPAPYRLIRAAPAAGPVVSASGLTLHAECALSEVGRADAIVIPGYLSARGARLDPTFLAWLGERVGDAETSLLGICTGAFYLAELGVLDGLPATTHWRSAARLGTRYPEVEVNPDAIYARAGRIWTSAGVTAGIDLALAMVEEDCGYAVAARIARELVVFLRRPGGQSQFSSYLAVDLVPDERIAGIQRWIADHLADDLSVDRLASRAAMSPRNFARVFRARTGGPPGRYVERCRVEAVRNALEHSDAPVEVLAGRFGFASAEVLRRVFLRHFGVAPTHYRARFS